MNVHVSSSTEGYFVICGDTPREGHGIVYGPFSKKNEAELAAAVHRHNCGDDKEGSKS